MRVPMIATRAMTYATRQLVADDSFEAVSRSDARLLAALGRAKLVEDARTAAKAPAAPAKAAAPKKATAKRRKAAKKA